MQLYRPRPRFPVFNALAVVDGKMPTDGKGRNKKRTMVMFQCTVAGRHDITTQAVVRMLKGLAPPTSRENEAALWRGVINKFDWEMIYVQQAGAEPIRDKQRCQYKGGSDRDSDYSFAKKFWDENVKQYIVKFDASVVAALDLALMQKEACCSDNSEREENDADE
ncbi:uncharacterized protein TEOVI_000736000 [Trypanosoma equiperdum]|uniref:Retrotransposon hot spot (RHS) protein n=1 Tax=Trypanosoma equiperdum TaxID=5694 RepID=A0A1G4HZU8_TRYEQ|nr:hypothetical protein TEOVI_000736000 [Trypanosoma equiperdum]